MLITVHLDGSWPPRTKNVELNTIPKGLSKQIFSILFGFYLGGKNAAFGLAVCVLDDWKIRFPNVLETINKMTTHRTEINCVSANRRQEVQVSEKYGYFQPLTFRESFVQVLSLTTSRFHNQLNIIPIFQKWKPIFEFTYRYYFTGKHHYQCELVVLMLSLKPDSKPVLPCSSRAHYNNLDSN